MISRIWFFNLLLAAGIAFFGFQTYKVWNSRENAIAAAISSKNDNDSIAPTLLQPNKLPESAYNGITRKNLFSPDRQPYVEEAAAEVKPPEVKQVKISGEAITLHGVIIMNDYKAALINNPMKKRGDKNTRWIKEGDVLGNFQVASIHQDNVIFKEGNKRLKVLLYDEKKSKDRSTAAAAVKPEKVQPTVVTTTVKKTKTVPAKVVIDEKKKPVSRNPFAPRQ